MPESIAELQNRLGAITAPGYRNRLLNIGLARNLIWDNGTLPVGGPTFPDDLTESLLDYGHIVLSIALRLRTISPNAPELPPAFLVAAEAIEAAVHRANRDTGSDFHRVSAAVAFHLARYAARGYSILPNIGALSNLSPAERALVHLLIRNLDSLRDITIEWVTGSDHQDDAIASRLSTDDNFEIEDATHLVLTSSFMRGMALFDHAIMTGNAVSIDQAKQTLRMTADAAGEFHAVNHWWTASLAYHLIDELWQLSLHERLPLLPPHDPDQSRWERMRISYIQRLRLAKRASIELWPSQVEAARRAIDVHDDLVVALPTSAGKTKIAELCILRTLAAGKRAIYVTPLRALSAQIERDLSDSFTPLGISVSSLYGSSAIDNSDTEILREGRIVVATPEKLDFALRNHPDIIDDVGLIVLDEGHMIGPTEREIRYEVLVQQLVRRNDRSTRRIVCLSALFPSPEEMQDFVSWIRDDEPGLPVHSKWRPTRQRFGVVQWAGSAARLDITVETESPFVPRFIETLHPPPKSRRRKSFPSNNNELALATAFKFIHQERNVLLYCALRRSVEPFGKLTLDCIRQGVLAPKGVDESIIRDALACGSEWLGETHTAVQCLKHGIALHHGGLPRPFLNEVEKVLRAGACSLIIASPTVAQGLNLSSSVVIVPSVWRNRNTIPVSELANVSGRAGRAYVDIEGLILHTVWELQPDRRRVEVSRWNRLVSSAAAPEIVSGLLTLSWRILTDIAKASGSDPTDVIEHIAGNDKLWSAQFVNEESGAPKPEDREQDLASLDAAILLIVPAETPDEDLPGNIVHSLSGSLFLRQLGRTDEKVQLAVKAFLQQRGKTIWSQSSVNQRNGYRAAAVGLSAGKFLDANLDSLVRMLIEVENAIENWDLKKATLSAVDFAQVILEVQPFRSKSALPGNWTKALEMWLGNEPATDVTNACNENGVDFVQEILMYRLPWGMEAVRVHGNAVGHIGASTIRGTAALSVQSGTYHRSAVLLLQRGFTSREGAISAVTKTNATFTESTGMMIWLASPRLRTLHQQDNWPTTDSRQSWLRFYEMSVQPVSKTWKRQSQIVDVVWHDYIPANGTHVILQSLDNSPHSLVCQPDLTPIGELQSTLSWPIHYLTRATVYDPKAQLYLEFYGPLT